MRVFVTGGTGLIGRHLVRRLLDRGDQPVVLSRQADRVRRDPAMRPVQVVQGDPSVAGGWDSALDGCDAVVNLVGHNIFADRWTPEVKRKIRDSRVYSTEHVVAAIAKARSRPKVLVNASAVGYYGPHGDEPLTEASPSGSDFLAVVCREWEEAASPAEAFGVRLALLRIGVVLARNEGALKAMTLPYKLQLGAAPLGNGGHPLAPATGQQWMSWVHVDDVVGLLLLALDNPSAQGPINATAPNPVRHQEFGKAFAKVLGRLFLPYGPPDTVVSLLLGEVAQVITTGQKALPEKARALGYQFQYPELMPALKALYARPPRPAARPHAPAAAAHHGGHH